MTRTDPDGKPRRPKRPALQREATGGGKEHIPSITPKDLVQLAPDPSGVPPPGVVVIVSCELYSNHLGPASGSPAPAPDWISHAIEEKTEGWNAKA